MEKKRGAWLKLHLHVGAHDHFVLVVFFAMFYEVHAGGDISVKEEVEE